MTKELTDYLAELRAEGYSEATLKNYRSSLGGFLKFLRSKRLRHWRELKPDHVDAYVQSLRRFTHGTQEGYVIAARCFVRWLHERGKLLANPTRHVVIDSLEPDDRPLLEPPLDEEDVLELIQSLPKRNVIDLRNICQLELLYSGGLRLGETIALDVEDVDMINRVLHVHGKGSKERDVPMMRGLHGALSNYLALRRSLLRGPDHGALLLSNFGRRMCKPTFERFLKRLNKQRRGKRRLHAHGFRHAIAVHLLRAGTDIRWIQEFLGHDSMETTKRYLKLVPIDLRQAYDSAMPDFAV